MHRASAIAARTIYRARQTLPKNEWSVLNKSNICTCSQTSALQCLDKANFELAWQSSAYGVSQQSFSRNQRSKFWTWQYTTSSKGEDKEKGKGEEEEAPDRTQADEASESAQGGPEETVSDADGTVEDSELAQKCESLEGTIKAKEAEIVDLKEKMLRVLADMENLRERTSRQIENSNKFAIQGFVKGLLDVSDNLERALTAVDDKYLEEPSEDGDTKPFKLLKSLHEGVKMTENQLLQVRRTCGKGHLMM